MHTDKHMLTLLQYTRTEQQNILSAVSALKILNEGWPRRYECAWRSLEWDCPQIFLSPLFRNEAEGRKKTSTKWVHSVWRIATASACSMSNALLERNIHKRGRIFSFLSCRFQLWIWMWRVSSKFSNSRERRKKTNLAGLQAGEAEFQVLFEQWSRHKGYCRKWTA